MDLTMVKGAKRLFISQPMTEKSNEEIVRERFKVVDKFLHMGYDVIDSVIHIDDDFNSKIRLKYIAKSLELLANADCAYFMEEWSKSSGCRVERMCCKEYGIEIIKLNEKKIRSVEMTKDQINEIIDMVQATAKVITDEIEKSDLIDDEKKKKLAIIEPAVSNIVDQLQIIVNEIV